MYILYFLGKNYFKDIFLQICNTEVSMKNFIKYFKICLILFCLLLMYIIFYAQSYSYAISSNLSNAVFRLHVLANSDSYEDQQLKLKVRDALLSYMNNQSVQQRQRIFHKF